MHACINVCMCVYTYTYTCILQPVSIYTVWATHASMHTGAHMVYTSVYMCVCMWYTCVCTRIHTHRTHASPAVRAAHVTMHIRRRYPYDVHVCIHLCTHVAHVYTHTGEMHHLRRGLLEPQHVCVRCRHNRAQRGPVCLSLIHI